MSIELPIAQSARERRAMLRIAIPSWRAAPKSAPFCVEDAAPSREDYQHLLDGAIEPADVTILRLTKGERRQLSISRRVRDALYGSASPV